MEYAFRVYAAIYGHTVVENPDSATVRFLYGPASLVSQCSRILHVPALYEDSASAGAAAAPRKCRYAGEEFHLRYGLDQGSSRPDWLGEIFLWLSNGYEEQTTARDEIGRIPYSETVFGREGLSPRKPHAALLMAWMEGELRNQTTPHSRGSQPFPKAASPVPGINHLVLSSHDIDFYFADRASVLVRLVKNLGIAIGLYRSWPYFADNSRMILQLLRGKRVGDYLPALVAASLECDLRSTFFVVSRRGHRRDPNYQLEQIASRLIDAAEKGFSIGLHGSYRSVIEDRSLKREVHILAKAIGQTPIAGRQHWLRFKEHRDLLSEIANAGFLIDSTLGFPDMVGFRNGASFAFPPYDFEREAPHMCLEVPLVLMDGSLQAASVGLRRNPTDLAEEVLAESRRLGWGGVSVLWHNPLDSISVPAEINQVFWTCAKRQKMHREKWVGVDQFWSAALPRYQQAGLLRGVQRSDASQVLCATAMS